jgi:hypothetical protein
MYRDDGALRGGISNSLSATGELTVGRRVETGEALTTVVFLTRVILRFAIEGLYLPWAESLLHRTPRNCPLRGVIRPGWSLHPEPTKQPSLLIIYRPNNLSP